LFIENRTFCHKVQNFPKIETFVIKSKIFQKSISFEFWQKQSKFRLKKKLEILDKKLQIAQIIYIFHAYNVGTIIFQTKLLLVKFRRLLNSDEIIQYRIYIQQLYKPECRFLANYNLESL